MRSGFSSRSLHRRGGIRAFNKPSFPASGKWRRGGGTIYAKNRRKPRSSACSVLGVNVFLFGVFFSHAVYIGIPSCRSPPEREIRLCPTCDPKPRIPFLALEDIWIHIHRMIFEGIWKDILIAAQFKKHFCNNMVFSFPSFLLW